MNLSSMASSRVSAFLLGTGIAMRNLENPSSIVSKYFMPWVVLDKDTVSIYTLLSGLLHIEGK
jgi:hypothetical protein